MPTVAEAIALALQYHQAGQLLPAEQIYRQVLAVDPSRADAWHLLGVLAHQQSQHAAAIVCIQRALELNPGFAEAHSNLGAAYFESGRLEEAVVACSEALRLNPDYAGAHAYLAWCYESRYGRAGLLEENRLAGIRHARLAIAAGADDPAALAAAAFVIGLLERDYETVFDAFDRAQKLNPSSALAFSCSSLIRAWTGDIDIAVEQANMAIRLSPFDALIYLPHIALCYAHLFAGRFEEAARAANRAAQSNPQFSIPCVLQAISLAKLGRLDDAKTAARRLLVLQPAFTIGGLVAAGFTSPERFAMLADAMRQAGLPE